MSRYHSVLLLAAVISCVLADEFPPLVVTCQYKVLDGDDFSNRSSYIDTNVTVFDYHSPNESSIPYINALYPTALFYVENKGDSPLQFSYSATCVNTTEDSGDPPVFSFESLSGSVSSIGPGQSMVFNLTLSEYNDTSRFYGQFIALMLVKGYDKAISFRTDVELAVRGCSNCLMGVCVEELGYCKCIDSWNDKTCGLSFQLNIENHEVCPGDPLPISYQLIYATCRGYWSIYPKDDYTPTYETGNLYSDNCNYLDNISKTDVTLFTYLTPGEYRFVYFLNFGSEEDGEVVFRVKDWEECGYEYKCAEYEEDKQCNGHGSCPAGACVCRDKYFWQDCSRGCSVETVLTNRTSIIDSDSGTDVENENPRYVPLTNCTWFIIPEGPGVDSIFINFTRFQLASSSDVLYVRSLNSTNGIDRFSTVLGKYTGTSIPQPKEYKVNKLALVFVTSYQGNALGFRLKYDAITDPMDGGLIAAIVLISFLVIVLIIVAIVLLTLHRKKVRDEALKIAKATPSEPWILTANEEELVQNDRSLGKDGVMPEQSELEKILGWVDMKSVDFECSDYELRFGLEDRMPCPVMTEMKQMITITNTSDTPLAFCFFHPVENYLRPTENYTYQCSLVPGKGTLAPGTGIRVQVFLKLMYTTRLDISIKCAVWRGARGPGDFYAFATADGITANQAPEKKSKKKAAPDTPVDNTNDDADEGNEAGEVTVVDPSAEFRERLSKSKPLKVARLTVHLEGAVSERIDPTDVVLNPEPLGEGAYGVVYSGRYRGRFVAVKVMSRQHDLLEQITKDFEREIDLYRRLHNPLIVEFVGASLIPGKLCMCTELIQRGSLEQLINEADIPIALQLRFAMNIAEAVAFLHSNNVLYRDLKPSNIMVVSTSLNSKINCKIGDFGTSRNVKDVTEFYQYTQGHGTPIYMAPEVLDQKPYNCKADVYSFAITLWQMETRERPWSNVPVWDVPKRVIHGKRPQMPPSLPKDYADVIRKCWSSKPDDRPSFSEAFDLLAPIAKRVKKGNKKDGKGKHLMSGGSDSTAEFSVSLNDSMRNNSIRTPTTSSKKKH